MSLSPAQIQQFKIDGYLVLPSALNSMEIETLNTLTQQHLNERIAPFELETDVHYPGAPASATADGADTIRRLFKAYERHEAFATLAKRPDTCSGIKQILDCKALLLNQNHHNCVMTKNPQFSSETLWHRDTRYWSFSDKYLINAWYALGDELTANGAMKILPGSHRWDVQEEALDEAQFLKLDHTDNQHRLATARLLELKAGDVLLFSAHCFHAAGKNQTNQPKFSAVFTYHGQITKALSGTHSASSPEIRVA